MPTQQRFTDKAALITGAASGIGRAVAVQLASEGARVLAFDINEDGLQETAKLAANAGGTVEIRKGDVSQRSECRDAVEAAVSTFGKLDVLGNIAGIARAEHVTDVTEEQYRKMMGVNADGYFFMCQAAIPHLLESSGNIVNIASNAGLFGQAYTVVYCMTKGAVVQLTKSLAMEFAKTSIRVNAIAPGGTDTALTANFQMPEDIDWDLLGRYAGFRGFGTPEDIAKLFAFVASDDGSNIHGSILSSDRGLTAG
jgi:NAD(P)-dependent dehydrogenase (short-subunit alcohol dehydrogenase family)